MADQLDTKFALRLQWGLAAAATAAFTVIPDQTLELFKVQEPASFPLQLVRLTLAAWTFNLIGAVRVEDDASRRKFVQYNMFAWIYLAMVGACNIYRNTEGGVSMHGVSYLSIAAIQLLVSIAAVYMNPKTSKRVTGATPSSTTRACLRYRYFLFGCAALHAVALKWGFDLGGLDMPGLADAIGGGCTARSLMSFMYVSLFLLSIAAIRGSGFKNVLRYGMFAEVFILFSLTHYCTVVGWHLGFVGLVCRFFGVLWMYEAAYPAEGRSATFLRMLAAQELVIAYTRFFAPEFTTKLFYFVDVSSEDAKQFLAFYHILAAYLFGDVAEMGESHRRNFIRHLGLWFFGFFYFLSQQFAMAEIAPMLVPYVVGWAWCGLRADDQCNLPAVFVDAQNKFINVIGHEKGPLAALSKKPSSTSSKSASKSAPRSRSQSKARKQKQN